MILIAALGFATRGTTLPWIGHWLNVGQDPQPTDYAMVLNGDADTRPFEAADLYRRGFAKRILITSVRNRRQSSEPETHELVRAVLIWCGVAEPDIEFIDSRCSSTFDEAETLAQFLSREPRATVCVVTSDFHTRRTRWVFRKVLGSSESHVRYAAAKTDYFDGSNWWQHENGFNWYLSEVLKFGFYLVRYGHGLAWITATAVVIGLGWWVRRTSLVKPAAFDG